MLSPTDARSVLPPQGLAPPTKRKPQTEGETTLPPGTIVVSADDHVSLSEDIWYERFPARLKDRAPRVWFEDGAFQFGTKGSPLLPKQFTLALQQYESMPGARSSGIEARLADMDAEGIDKALVFPNALQVLFGYPDFEIRELCFRIYNQYLAELQERAPGRFYGVGLINWWDPKGTRQTLEELKSLGLKTFLLPLKPGVGPDGQPIDYTSAAMDPVWAEIEAAGLPVSHHIGEAPQLTQYNFLPIGFLHNAGGGTFREMFGRYVFGGILDRHPGLRIGWYEGGINWVVSTLQDAELSYASFRHTCNWNVQHDVEYYWKNHMWSSFMVDPLGLELIDRIGADRVMWAADYPHSESSFSYSRNSLKQVVDIVGPERAKDIVGGNAIRFLNL